jgi:transaldolase
MPQTSPLFALHRLGQSPWLDFLSRKLLASGQLGELIEQRGLRGVTSNPAIFHKAISEDGVYDAAIAELARSGLDAAAIYETLAVQDVASAADLFRPMYEETAGADGFVSLEVSPRLAHATLATIEEGRRLWSRVARPNAMIKVPATPEGLPAIRRLLADGINVNVTLLFGLDRYREVTESFLAGLEERVAGGGTVDRVASVASFFLSRIDTLIDPRLDAIAARGGERAQSARELRGEAAIASARKAYAISLEVFQSARFASLRARGARPQRLLWASTGTKDPAYTDVKYVEPLIAPDTVNTMPLETLEAYHRHGHPERRLDADALAGADSVLQQLRMLNVDLDEVTRTLLREAVQKFVDPFDALLEAIAKRAALEPARSGAVPSPREGAGAPGRRP